VAAILPFALYNHPLLYNPEPLDRKVYYTHLNDGTPIEICLTPSPSNSSQNISSALAALISQKLLSFTELLYSPIFGGCFNPFEEVVQNGERMMPGWRLGVETSETGCMISVESMRLTLSDPGSLS